MRAIKYCTTGLLTVGLLIGGAGLAAAQTNPSGSSAPVPNNATKDPVGGGNVTGSGGMGPTGTHDMNSKKANKAGKHKAAKSGGMQANPPPKTTP